MSTLDTALAAALAGEHAAIYAYGVLGPHLTGVDLALAKAAELAHRNTRDGLLETLQSPPPAGVLYQMPFAATDTGTALALAVYVEEHCAALWRDVVVAADPATRGSQLAVLTTTEVRAVGFRRAGGSYPGTVAFPGLGA